MFGRPARTTVQGVIPMFGASLGSLSLKDLKLKGGQQGAAYRSWEDLYRQKWTWDKVAFGSHCVDCYPGNCSFRVYVKDGMVWRYEQRGLDEPTEKGVPDLNPMGCNKGAAWSQLLYAPERVLYPLKRAGERGEGKWKRVSWDEALTGIADDMLDAIQEVGPESIIHISTPAQGGFLAGLLNSRLMNALGGLHTDVQSEINDFSPGTFLTFGKFAPVASVDDLFHSELTFIWHHNPVYASIPWYHFVAESRYNGGEGILIAPAASPRYRCVPESPYNGGEVILIAPDASPSSVHTDYFVPVRVGSDSALALGMCQVLIEEGLYNATFVKEQTDLAFRVRDDSHRLLRQSDVQASGRDNQFYFFDTKSEKVVEASRGNLALGDIDPALEGTFEATLMDGSVVKVRPVFDLLRRKVDGEYTPDKASQVCGVNPDVIRSLARQVDQKKTRFLNGWDSGKYHHGDLMERSMCLLLGLTGNWGKKGTGIRSWSAGLFDGFFMGFAKERAGRQEARRVLNLRNAMISAIKAQAPTMTDEIAAAEMAAGAGPMDTAMPSCFMWYYHCGYNENWNKPEWSDPSMKRPFDEYLKEALDKGWWGHTADLTQGKTPRVMFEIGGHLLRRTRGGQTMLLKHLWPQPQAFGM